MVGNMFLFLSLCVTGKINQTYKKPNPRGDSRRMWPFMMGLSQYAGGGRGGSSIYKAFGGGGGGNNRILDIIDQFLPDQQKLIASATPGEVAQAFHDLSDAFDIDVTSKQSLERASDVPLLMLSLLTDGGTPGGLLLQQELEIRRGDGFGDPEEDTATATRELNILKHSRLAKIIWGVFDRMTDLAWSKCRPRYDDRATFLMAMQPEMGPEYETLPLRKAFIGEEKLDRRPNPRGKGAGGVVPWVFTPSELGERQVIKEMFSYLPRDTRTNCNAAKLRESLQEIFESNSFTRVEKKVFGEIMADYEIPKFIESLGVHVLQVLGSVHASPTVTAKLPAVIGLTRRVHPLRVFVPELKKIEAYQRKRVRGGDNGSDHSNSKRPRSE